MNSQKMIIFLIISILINSLSFAEEKRQIKIGSLQSWYSAAGAEIEVGRRNLVSDQQDGLRWPALYENQDTEAAKALWIGCTNYSDPINGQNYPHKVVHVGPRVLSFASEIIPVNIDKIGRTENPQVFVNGIQASDLYFNPVDEIDANLECDRMIQNITNTSLGVTVKRKIHAFTNQDHDNYFIYDYVFKNTGLYDVNGSSHNMTLDSVVFFLQYRYAVAKEACSYAGFWLPQSCTWGHSTMLETSFTHPITSAPFRTQYSWLGKHSGWNSSGDCIGGPNYTSDGHLGASQYVGTIVLHADTSPQNQNNDLNQSTTTQYLDSDDPINNNNNQFNAAQMTQEYLAMIAGHPLQTHAQAVGSGFANDFGGTSSGFSHGQGFGPYTLQPGDSIHIVLAEAVSGLNRDSCYSIGANWLDWSNGGTGPYLLPDGSSTSNGNDYKNAWVWTGRDSLFKTFENAENNFNSGFNIPVPPPPPETVEIISDSLFIHISWADNATTWPNFAGYEIYRTTGGTYDPDLELIYSCGQNTPNPTIIHTFNDTNVVFGVDYYYYIVSLDDGSTNNGVPLGSSKFWTLTNEPAFLTNNPGIYADVYVSPGGDDNNSGLSWAEPLLTITNALQKIRAYSLQPRTIYVGSGIYSPSTTGETFPLNCKSDVTISGSGAWYPVLDAESTASIFTAQTVENLGIENLTIQNGLSDYGAGIKCTSVSNLSLSNVEIKNNSANINGGGVYLTSQSNLIFDSSNRCNIHSNSSGLIGDDIYTTPESLVIDVIVDTFTVISPSDYYAYPTHKYNFDILNYKIAQENADLYVSTIGDDNNTGLNSGVPLRTITNAIKKINANAQNPHTIHLAQGTYNQSQTGESFPVYTKSYVSISGENKTTTILDGEQNSNLIYCYGDNNLTLDNLSIINGFTTHHGGGIFCNAANLTLNNVLITKDSSNIGAGIYCDNSILNLSDVTIKENSAMSFGAGIVFFNYSDAIFDPVNRCNIYNNSAPSQGKDLYNIGAAQINVVLDTFTVLFPIDEFAFPVNNFTYDINYGLKYQVNGDVYVDPTGDDNNTGTSAQDPLRTINYALDVIYSPYNDQHSIYLADGVYGPSANGDSLPIIPKEYVMISGNSEENTILDGEGQFRIFEAEYLDNYFIGNLTVQNGFAEDGGGMYLFNSNPEISNVTFLNNKATDDGGGIFCENSNPYFYAVTFENDSAINGGAVHLRESDAEFERVIFSNNKSKFGAALYSNNSSPIIINSTFNNNVASTRGGAIENRLNSEAVFINSILWADTPQEIHCFNAGYTISHSDIQGGESGITGTTTATNWLSGNRDLDPLFVGGNPFDFNLTQNSPCVDKGTDLFVWQGDTIINLPDTSYFSSAPDMGALESQFVSKISPKDDLIPERFALYQNYPNPFNPITKIKYDLPEKSEVKLIIYDMLGRKVRLLVNKSQLPGQKIAVWDALNDQGYKVASGLYIYKLVAGDYVKSRKMLLMK
jgi:predicted outer membrane repeat protein